MSASASPPSARTAPASRSRARRRSWSPCPPEELKADPTGVGDAFRAGFLAGLAWELSHERCAQIGSLLATYVIETVGTQEYDLAQQHFLARFADTYGADAADEVARNIRCPRP